jgi:hypothetical protein
VTGSNAEGARPDHLTAPVGTPAGPRTSVLRGGQPTHEQAAALAAALLTVAVTDAGSTAAASGWQRAALLEGVGSRPFAQRSDLDTPGLR